LKANTLRAHLGLIKVFFDRTIECGWDDTPARPGSVTAGEAREVIYALDLPTKFG
jgi:hypothetical protein